MNEIKLYGMAGSRAFRSIWAAEELGLEYEHVGTSFQADSKTPEYLAVNPNGRIPALDDNGFTLFESMAINMYLGEKYGAGLLPTDLALRAKTWQWSVWGISEIEPLQMQIVIQKLFMPEDKLDAKAIASATKALSRPLAVLDASLANQNYLLGEEFSLADLNLAGVMDLFVMIQFDVSAWPNVEHWLARCRSRPSYSSAKAKGT